MKTVKLSPEAITYLSGKSNPPSQGEKDCILDTLEDIRHEKITPSPGHIKADSFVASNCDHDIWMVFEDGEYYVEEIIHY